MVDSRMDEAVVSHQYFTTLKSSKGIQLLFHYKYFSIKFDRIWRYYSQDKISELLPISEEEVSTIC